MSRTEKNDPANSPFARMVHLGVVVSDIDKTVKQLSSLGLAPFEEVYVPPFIGTPLFRGKPMTAKVKGVVTTKGGMAIELIQPLEGNSPWQEFLDTKGEGIHHIAFGVDNLDEQIDDLVQQGCAVLKITRRQEGGSAYIDQVAGGVIVELEQTQLW
jgi:methylmalonyl-CoA/ethylmalonyl-CoA epimerase